MKNKFENIEDLIAKFLAGEASAEEIQILEEWKSLHADNLREFNQMNMLFTESATLKPLLSVNSDKAWLAIQQAIQLEKGRVVQLHKRSNLQTALRIAAIFIFMAMIGAVIYFMTSPLTGSEHEIATGDTIQKSMLPDGSEITLNKHSSIQYASNAYSKKRVVKLKGEAFFDVKHNETVPFIVEAGELQIQDIGTAFNVNARQNSGIIFVSVVSGEVKIITAEDKSILLSAGEAASYNSATMELKKSEEIDRNASAYKDKIFIFENAELIHVLKTLNDIYYSDLRIGDDKISSCRITVSFNNEKIEDIADVIALTLGLSLQKSNGTITFHGDACK
ncbi:MAG: FecR domain-containing protein [Bacteroidetes bacterium]|nr:FecR domain-containing protein [Bacteroidota bacterium]